MRPRLAARHHEGRGSAGKLSRRGLRCALEGLVVQHLTVARVADGLGVSWNSANNAVLAEGQRALIDDPHRFDGVQVIGVPKPLNELIALGRTLKKRDLDVLAYFDRPGSSNGPTEAINGRLEHPPRLRSASATSPTTSPGVYSRPADSDPDYPHDSEEPV
jgi:hypothetical protein